MKIKHIAVLAASALILTACTHEGLLNKQQQSPAVVENETVVEETKPAVEDAPANGGAMVEGVVVTVAEEGFTPKEVTVKKGQKVTWKNESSRNVWVASAFHPTHDVYPEFDQLKGMAKGESYSFTFDKVGSWAYHDHLNPTFFGKVIVGE